MLMVHYFYYLDYDARGVHSDEDVSQHEHMGSTNASDGNMMMHAKVFACAIKYQVPGLKALSIEKFAAAAETHWDHESFAEVIKTVYTTTPAEVKGLRDIVTTALHTHHVLLNTAEIQRTMREIDGLSFELLEIVRPKPQQVGGPDVRV